MSDFALAAVFLSYASQDAELVRRIAEALRASGVEVWFDQNELVGGDAWDAKIRGQIKSCALFVPVISAATQARREGYFRLEWKLAAQRTHTMADGTPFLLPVVIDATKDGEALVPEEFRAVQWTRLPGGETTPTFCSRVKTLLGGGADPSGSAVGTRLARAQEEGRAPAAPPQNPVRSWSIPAMVGVGLVAAVAAFVALRPYRGPEDVAKPVATGQTNAASATAKSTATAVPQTEVQKLIARLWAIHELEQDGTQEEWALAEDLGAQAVKLEPNNAAAWAAYSVATWGNGVFNNLPLKSEEAQRRASRAITLAPDSFEARLAVANLERLQASTIEHAERLFRQLVAERPDDKRALRKLSYTLRDRAVRAKATSFPEEAITLLDRAAALPGGDASALMGKAGLMARYSDKEANLDAALKLRNGPNAFAFKMLLLFQLHGKLDEALELLKQAPSSFWVKPGKTATVAWFWLCRRDHKQALAALAAVQNDFLNGDSFGAYEFVGPRSALIGQAHQMAGNVEAAQLAWQAALRVVDQRLPDAPNDTNLYFWKAWLLVSLGRSDEARVALKIFEQISGRAGPQIESGLSWRPNRAEIYLKLGERNAVLDMLEQREQLVRKGNAGRAEEAAVLRNRLTYEPAWDLLRGDARFEALIVRLSDLSATSPSTAKGDSEVATRLDDKSVAVLAFANRSDDAMNEIFSDGISEELINVLGRVPGLTVKGRASSFYFKNSAATAQEKGQKLGATFLVDGSVRKMGNTVRITAQVIRAATDEVVWSSEPLVREAKDVFAVQEEIAGMIAKALSLKLGVASAAAATSVDPEAFRLYIEGRREWNRRLPAGYARAELLLKRAIELAPGFAQAHAALGDVWELQGEWDNELGPYDQRDGALAQRVQAKAREALALDPQCAEAHASLGLIAWNRWRFAEGEEALRTALRINPSYASAHQWLGRNLMVQGRLDEALAALGRAAELDPLSPRILDNLAGALVHAGRPVEALAALDRALALQPDALQAASIKAQILARRGRRDEAMALVKAVPSGVWISSHWRVTALGFIGDAEARSLLGGYLNDRNAVTRFTALLGLGREEEALQSLVPGQIESTRADVLLFDPIYDRVRTDARFTQALATIGLAEAHARAQAWRAKQPAGGAAAR